MKEKTRKEREKIFLDAKAKMIMNTDWSKIINKDNKWKRCVD